MQEPSQTEFFVRTHTKKSTGDLVSNKAKEMHKYGDDLSKHSSSDLDLWCKVTGGTPHGNLYGMGSSVDCRVRRAPRLFEPKFPARHCYLQITLIERHHSKCSRHRSLN